MRAAGQNLKRLLKKRGWGRRPCPAEAVFSLFLAAFGRFAGTFFEVIVDTVYVLLHNHLLTLDIEDIRALSLDEIVQEVIDAIAKVV